MGNESRSAIGHLYWLGIALIALGMAAVLDPAVAGSALMIVIGFILLFAGTVPIVRELKAEASKEITMGLILGSPCSCWDILWRKASGKEDGWFRQVQVRRK